MHPGVIVRQSRLYETNSGIIQGPQGSLVVDPGIYPEEMEDIASRAGTVTAGFCTHAHWDHVLWDESLGESTPRFASAETVALMHRDRQRHLARFDRVEAGELEITGSIWNRDLFFREQSMPWGEGEIAGIPVELIPARGHEDGQTALLLPDHDVCFVADTLSDIEVPSFSGMRALGEYQLTLDRLQRVIDRVSTIVPGHGAVADRAEAQHRLDADRRYLEALASMMHADSVRTDSEEVAQIVLRQLGENRATADLSWSMHLRNVQSLLREREIAAEATITRRSSRLMVLNHAGEVWMLRINDTVRPRWILPGGGVEEGETWEQAAIRELWEECEIRDVPLGPMVAERKAVGQYNDKHYNAHERYFVVNVGDQQPGIANMIGYEVDDYTQQAWWSADQLRASHETTYPIGLADILDSINAGEIADDPVLFVD